jgi:hypothetical protein
MSRPSAKKQKKQKARQRSVAKKKAVVAERRQYGRSFPQFISLDVDDADPVFVALIQQAARTLDLRDRSLFSADESQVFKWMKKHGFAFTGHFLDELKDDPVAGTLWATKIGHIIFSRIPREQLVGYLPYNDVHVFYGGRDIYLKFRSLRRQSSPGGVVYYSRYRPTLDIDGIPKIVGFSRHAIERACDRLVPRWQNYAALGDAFAFFDQCLHFERSDLPDGQLAFTFFAECTKGFITESFVDEVLGRSIDDGTHFYYRVGYCPAVVEGAFVKAMTLCPPGFRGTPEYRAIAQSDLPRDEKTRLLRQATEINLDEIKLNQDFGLIKWFHDHGVPQVVESREVFYASAL